MILAKSSIREALDSGNLEVSPLDSESIQPASVDLRLGTHFLVPDLTDRRSCPLGEVPMVQFVSDRVVIPAHGFLLARTVERVRLADTLTGFVEGRSSVGRGGLFIHNAGFVDPGFDGTITLELFNAHAVPLELWAGRRICQLVLMECKGISGGYHGKYQHQVEATASRFNQDAEALR